MEGAFGRSFDGVRVHTDARASGFAAEHQAEAVTTGQDIAFGTSKYRPGTEGGDRLLAHELTHVVQQGNSARGAPQAKSEVSTPNEPAEMQADAAASRVVSGQPAGVTAGGYSWSTRNRLMRKALSGAGAPGMSVPVPVPGKAAETAGPTEAKTDNGTEVTGGPPGKKRKKPEEAGAEAEAGEAARAQEKAPGEEGAGTEGKTAEARQAGVEEPAPVRKKLEGKQGPGAVVGGGLAGRLAQSLRAKETRGEEKPALSPGANEALREAAESGKAPGSAGTKKEEGKAGEAKTAGLQAPEGKAPGEVARPRETKPAGEAGQEKAPFEAKAGVAGKEPGAPVEGKAEAKDKGAKGKDGKGAEAEGAGAAEKGAEGAAGPGKKLAGPESEKALAGEKEEGAGKGKGGDASAKAEGQAKARQGVPGDVKKAL
ncbi:eCIS core domain-containing protein, partial [Corallococcus carmarthensis]|uniref:eCIS core domain-containing protein n=1 Tax=Corallococcus carmarthensis TaxID=2316728 RepID=UPI00148CBA7E